MAGLGYELVDVELPGKGRLLRVYIDRLEGISVEDCARVSSHLSRVLTVENVPYERLEVSSPGLDRPLRGVSAFRRFVGHKAQLRLRAPVDGRRRFTGEIRSVSQDELILWVDGKEVAIKLSDLGSARLVPTLNVGGRS